MLPKDYPKWATSHSYFQQWGEAREDGLSLSKEALKNAVGEAIKNGRNDEYYSLIIDSQNVKNEDKAKAKGYDFGKKILGIKRHIFVNSFGLALSQKCYK